MVTVSLRTPRGVYARGLYRLIALAFVVSSMPTAVATAQDEKHPREFIRIEECQQDHEALDCPKSRLILGRDRRQLATRVKSDFALELYELAEHARRVPANRGRVSYEPGIVPASLSILDASSGAHSALQRYEDSIDAACEIVRQAPVVEYVNAEVDVNSRIRIGFDREWLTCLLRERAALEADVMIQGVLKGSRGTRNIEIPGYYITGEESKSASARVYSAHELWAIIEAINEQAGYSYRRIAATGSKRVELPSDEESYNWGWLDPLFDAVLLTSAELETLRAQRSVVVAREGELADLGRRISAEAMKRQANADQVERLEARLAEAVTDSVGVALRPQIAQLRGQVNDSRRLIDDLEAQRADLKRRLDEFMETRDVAYWKYEALRTMQQEFVNRKSLIGLLTRKLRAPAYRPLIQALARSTPGTPLDPDMIIQLAADIDERWYPVIERDLSLEKLDETSVRSVVNAARNMGSLMQQLSYLTAAAASEEAAGGEGITTGRGRIPERLSLDLMRALRDTDVLLAGLDAEPGDEILLTISNNAEGAQLARTLIVRLVVRDFELVRRVSDSFLFVKGNTREKIELSDGTTEEVDSQFGPTAGATLSWTYYGRKGLLRFLNPGFGVNVSFPVTGATVVRYLDGSSDPSAPDPLLEIEERERRVNIAAGPVLTLFDNALQFTAGLNLTSGRGFDERLYFGVGFSFVNLARKIVADE